MAVLNKSQIEEIAKDANLKLIDCSKYKNLNSFVIVECPNGHRTSVSVYEMRKMKNKYRCCTCENKKSVGFTDVLKVPEKSEKVVRLVAFDQSSKVLGISIWDDDKLVYYTYIAVQGEVIERIRKIFYYIHDFVIPVWKPDHLAFEDIQMQGENVLTYKILAMVLGVCQVAAEDRYIKYSVIPNKTWQSAYNIQGKRRDEQKSAVIKKVHDYYNILVPDDIADAILLGRYAVQHLVEHNFF